MSYRNFLSLDVGQRRIGVAIASLESRLAHPYTFIDRLRKPDVPGLIKDIVQREAVKVVVVGLPRGLSGEDTAQTTQTRLFARDLEAVLEIPVVMQDEAGTSVEATARLQARGKPYGKGDIDSEAAAIILADYLEQAKERVV